MMVASNEQLAKIYYCTYQILHNSYINWEELNKEVKYSWLSLVDEFFYGEGCNSDNEDMNKIVILICSKFESLVEERKMINEDN